MFSSVQEVSEGLRKAGYIADSIAVTTVFLASSLHRPVLSEGPAGSGKTQLAYAVAQAANTNVERLQCYEGIGEDNPRIAQQSMGFLSTLRLPSGSKPLFDQLRRSYSNVIRL